MPHLSHVICYKYSPVSCDTSHVLHHEKTCFILYVNHKDTDQPAHLPSLISVFVIHRIIPVSLLSISEIVRLLLASVAEQACLSDTWHTPLKTGFLITWLM